MIGLPISEEELRALLVTRLEVVDAGEFDKARTMARRFRMPLERALVARGRIPLKFLLEQLAQDWKVGFIDLKANVVNPEALRTVEEGYARAHILVPFDLKGKQLQVAMLDPRNRRVIEEIERRTKLHVTPHLAPEGAIRRAHLLYRDDLREILKWLMAEDNLTPTPSRGPRVEDKSATELLTQILEFAAVVRASDIHIEPYEQEILVRYRIDGILYQGLSLPPAALASLVARIKVLAGMRIDQRQAPQDGRFEADLGGIKLDLRVSSMPTHWQEKVVLRVLPKEGLVLELEDLGLTVADYQTVLRNLLRPFGMILVTGPTGAGKSTSLYAMLMRLGAERQNIVNISTIEDPVEYTLPRVNQVTIKPAAGITFSTGLRALLRQDPDVLMVGEIRDRETAEIAVGAALVGRILLSTLHTNDATSTVLRLLDMGVEPFLVASTLTLVVTQRLVRRICVNCRESVVPDPSMLTALQSRADFAKAIEILQAEGVLGKADDPLLGIRLFRGKGCAQCNGSGFRGRMGVFELFEIDDELRRMIMERQDAVSIRAAAIARGMKTMAQDGLAKAFLGETTLEEVVQVTQ